MEPRICMHSAALRSPYPGKSSLSNPLPQEESVSPLTASDRWLDTTWSSAVSSSPTPANAVAKRRASHFKQPKGKAVLRSSSRRAFRPVPLRHKRFLHSEYSRSGPRSPNSSSSVVFVSISHSRLHGAETPRAPGGMWLAGSSSSGLALPSSSPLPPEIKVTPPAAEVQSLLQRCTVPSMRITPQAAGQQKPEHQDPVLSKAWQHLYVSSQISKDQAAFEKLGWKLDLAFAALACHSSTTESSEHFSSAHLSKIQETSKAVIARLTSVWNPRSATEYAISPPSVRIHVPTEPCKSPELDTLDRAAALAWVHSITAILGADMVDKIASHVVQALWYTAVQDERRTFPRPATVALLCQQLLDMCRIWAVQESHMHSRKFPIHHLCDIPCCTNTEHGSLCSTSMGFAALFATLLSRKLSVKFFETIQACRSQFSLTGGLRVPIEGKGMRQPSLTLRGAAAQHGYLGKSIVSGPSLVDAARLLGELFKLGIVAELAMVTMWFDILLDQAAQRLPAGIEAACSLLLLVDQAPVTRNGSICQQMTSLSLQHPRKRKSGSDLPNAEMKHVQNTLEPYRQRLTQLGTREHLSKSMRKYIQVRS